MSGSGNMIPQSIRRIRPSTSMQAQLRPISPRPPRKTTRTGLLTPSESSRAPGTRSAPPSDPGRRRRDPGYLAADRRRHDDTVEPADPAPLLPLAPQPPDDAAEDGDELQRSPDEAQEGDVDQEAAVLPLADHDGGGQGEVEQEAQRHHAGGHREPADEE